MTGAAELLVSACTCSLPPHFFWRSEKVRGTGCEAVKCRHCRFQLERLGYFHVDPDSKPGAVVLNRICTLKERVAKQEASKKGAKR